MRRRKQKGGIAPLALMAGASLLPMLLGQRGGNFRGTRQRGKRKQKGGFKRKQKGGILPLLNMFGIM